MDASTLLEAEVWRVAAGGDVSQHQKWLRISGLLQGWPLLSRVPSTEWFTILSRLRSILVLDQRKPVAGATSSREAAASLLKHIVAGALESTSPAVDGVEVYRQKITHLLTSDRAGGSVLDILLALFSQEEPQAVVASAAQALGLVVQVVGQDEQLKREQLLAPSTLLKAIKQMVRKLNQLAQKQDHTTGLADMVRGAMACLRALGGTVRPQCAAVEEACLHLLDSPHPAVRKAVAECFSVRPWCGGIEEWPALVGSLMSTIHLLLDSAGYPNEAILRKGLPPPFSLPQRESIVGSVSLEHRLGTLFATLRHCLGAPPTNQPVRAVPVPIPHMLDLIRRVLALSPVSTHFESLDRATLGLWTLLPNLHGHSYRLLSSLIACVGRHLMPHYPAVRRLIVHGLERNSSQAHGAAWTRTFHFLLESIGLAFPVLASCLWKDSATAILSLVLPLLSPQHTATHTAVQRALQLSALKVVGAVVRHAGPLLSSLHAIEIHRTVLAAIAKPVSRAFQEEIRRVLSDCCLLPQTAPLLPGTLRVLQCDAHLQSTASTSSPASASAVAGLELLIHPRVLPRVRLAPPPVPTVAAALAAVPLAVPAPAPVRPLSWERAEEQFVNPSAKRKSAAADGFALGGVVEDSVVVDEMVVAQPQDQAQLYREGLPAHSSASTAVGEVPLSKRPRTESLSSSSSSSSTSSLPSTPAASSAPVAPLPGATERGEPFVQALPAEKPVGPSSIFASSVTAPPQEEEEDMADIVADGPDTSDDEDEGDEEDDDVLSS